MKILFSTLIIFQLSISLLHAQFTSNTNDNNQEPEGIYKLNVASLINGDMSFSYERILSDFFSVEAGVGYLLPYHLYDITSRFENWISLNPDFGYSILFSPKFYALGEAPDFKYYAIQYRLRHYVQNKESIIFNDFSFIMGSQFIMDRKYILDVFVGAGGRHYSDEFKVSNNFNFNSSPLWILGCKVGFVK